jgi:hypothetical protein
MAMLNIGCGKVLLPGPRPGHHTLVDDIYSLPDWHNVDRNMLPGVDEAVDTFSYPWPWPDNSFDGALAAHIVEHIPHEARIPALGGDPYGALLNCGPYWAQNVTVWRKRAEYLAGLQDGWFVWFSELYRVLKPGALAHILVPHGHSDGALGDPTHTRYVLPHTFGYFDADGGTFEYAIGSNWRIAGEISYHITEMFQPLLNAALNDGDTRPLQEAIMLQNNAVYEFYVRLEALKDGG